MRGGDRGVLMTVRKSAYLMESCVCHTHQEGKNLACLVRRVSCQADGITSAKVSDRSPITLASRKGGGRQATTVLHGAITLAMVGEWV